MTWLGFAQQALINMKASKLRSVLAVLGILVGTAAVVALLSSGRLATDKALAQFKALGTDLLAVVIYPKQQDASKSGGDELSLSQWRQLSSHIPSLLNVAPYATTYQSLSYEGHVIKGAIVGADEQLAKVIHIDVARGQFVSYLQSYEHVCVIGEGIAKQMEVANLEDPVGKQLRIGNTLYTVIGVASPWKENAFFNEDINHSVILPIAGIPLVSASQKINNAVMRLKTDSAIDEVIRELKQVIQAAAPKLQVFPRSAKQIIASMESQGHIFTLLLGVIGGVSLLVGGIGVMNVMLVSVSERKKEIGIRKAVGATHRDIQALFLVESIMLALLGGVLGVVSGLALTRVIAWFSAWPFHFYIMPPLAGFGVSVATGIFFGFYPARRAAQLEPIACLRSE